MEWKEIATMASVSKEHIEIVQGAGGPKARIVGHNIRVQDIVVLHEKLGMSTDEILEELPTITPADVYAALAYYWDHREEIESRLAADEAYMNDLRGVEGPLIEKLKRLRSG